MKFLLLPLTVLLAASSGFAMSRPLPQDIKDESLSNVSVAADFSLRASDGSLINLVTDNSKALSGLQYLPPEKNADHRKCGGTGDVSLMLKLGDVILRSVSVQGASYSPADIAILQSIPRCEPYLELLGSIGNSLAPVAPVDQDLPSKLAVVKTPSGYALQLTTKAGRQALFQITANLKGITSVKDLAALRLPAITTGQNAGIQFTVSDPQVSDPTASSSVQSCSFTQSVNRCDRDPKKGCHTEYVTIFGHQDVSSSTTMTSYDVSMQIVSAEGRTLMSAQLLDLDFNTQSDQGRCHPDPGQDFGGPHRP